MKRTKIAPACAAGLALEEQFIMCQKETTSSGSAYPVIESCWKCSGFSSKPSRFPFAGIATMLQRTKIAPAEGLSSTLRLPTLQEAVFVEGLRLTKMLVDAGSTELSVPSQQLVSFNVK